jgi:hypothetical protein
MEAFNFTKFEPFVCPKEGTLTTTHIRMEGANGKILDTDTPSVVIKKIHRRNRAQQRKGSLTAEEQARTQEWARRLCLAENFQLLFVPRAWDAERFQYKMDRIDVTKPLEILEAKNHPVFEELTRFYAAAKRKDIFPADYELYIQPDGRVAMVDFDKFAIWNSDGTITFPWGMVSQEKDMLEPLGLWQK